MKKLLIVVDYQKDFVDGSLGFEKAKQIEEYLVKKIEQYHHNQDTVVFTFDTHKEDYLSTREGINLPIKHCIKGSDGHRLYGKVEEVSKGDILIEKNTFGSKDLATFLSLHPFDEICLVGVVTSMCVLSNAVIAKTMCPEADIYLDKNGCADFSSTLEEKAYDVLKNLQIRIVE